jgi:hypothetical protein
MHVIAGKSDQIFRIIICAAFSLFALGRRCSRDHIARVHHQIAAIFAVIL